MASNLVSFRPAGFRASAAPGGDRKAEARSRNWWTPLFGWSSEADYIEAEKPAVERRRTVAFTEEKARQLRLRTTETETFHDAMYHSAIASRLASDLSRTPNSNSNSDI